MLAIIRTNGEAFVIHVQSLRASFTGLLVLLAAALMLVPLAHAGRAPGLGLELAVIVAMVLTLWRLRPGGILVFAAVLFAFASRVAATAAAASPMPVWVVLELLASVAFLGTVAVVITVDVWRRREVTSDTIVGGIAVYVIIGVAWSGLFQLTEFLIPGSFAVAHPASGYWGAWEPAPGSYPRLTFFSFVTLTTLGYGDIAPVSIPATMLAAVEAMVGPIYLTVLIARLVGLHVAQSSRERPSEGDDLRP